MRKSLGLLTALVTIGAVPHHAIAAEPLVSGEGMLAACEELERTIRPTGGDWVNFTSRDAGECWAFVGAMQQVSRFTDPTNRSALSGTCLPPDSTLTQLIRVFTSFARAHPEVLHERPAQVVLWAFQSAFPCQR
jgi:Rap1a immunity proteins